MTGQPNPEEPDERTAVADARVGWRGREVARHAGKAVVLTLVLTVLTGLLFPLVTGAIAQVLFPTQANGTILRASDGTIVGSALIGQQFVRPEYFHPRPSAAGDKGYDATQSGGSNLGPTNPKLLDVVRSNAQAYRQENGLASDVALPPDAIMASGSGLDPEISPANAFLQVARVARARGRSETEVRALVERHVEGRTLGILGEPRVNVLELNLALDQAPQAAAHWPDRGIIGLLGQPGIAIHRRR